MTQILIDRATLEQMVDALEASIEGDHPYYEDQLTAIESLRAALAQQGEQAIGYVRTINGEPTPDDNNTIFSYGENPYRDVMGDEEWVAVYTAAPAPQAHGIREVK